MKQVHLIIAIFSFFLISLSIKAQELSWSAFFGNEGAEFANDIKPTTDNGYIIGAYANDGGSSDFYIVKLNAFGELIWEKTISKNAGSERLFSIHETSEGNYVAIGNATNSNKPWVVKLNSAGDTLWTSIWTDTIFDNSGLLARGTLLPNGNIVIVSHTDYYALDPYMFILDADGALIAERDLESLVPVGWFSGTTIQDIESTQDGGFVICGSAGGTIGARAFLWKFNSLADSVWSVIYNENEAWMRSAQSVKELSDGGYLLTGYTAPNSTKTAAIKTDELGNLMWFQEYPDTLYTQGTDIIEFSPDQYIISEKRFSGFGTSFFQSAILRINNNGTLMIREPILVSDSSTTILQIRNTPDGGFVMAGEINEYLNIGEQDLCVVKSDSLGNISNTAIDYVWPGDINLDGIVNMNDLIILGVTAGEQGPPRTDQSIDWYPHYVTDWNDTIVTGVNYKHADTDGNGIVNIEDTLAILVNYDSLHIPLKGSLSQLSAMGIYLFENEILIENGSRVSIPLYIGEQENPIQNLYGMRYLFHFNPEVIDGESINISYNNTWLDPYGNHLWSLTKDLPSAGYTDHGVTLNNHENVSGFGQMAILHFNLKNPLVPGESITTDLFFDQAIIYSFNLDMMELPTSSYSIEIKSVVSGLNYESDNLFSIFPNPVSTNHSINVNTATPISSYRVIASSGSILEERKVDNEKIFKIGFPFDPGLYLLKLFGENKIFVVKVVITK